ncbi:MAG: hypothetical protein COB61_005745 [Thiotrichales bacterium]|nr:hypothetical protein [Thiotrichales bacterium]
MNFQEFERLEKFNILTNKIEENHYKKNSSLKGKNQTPEKTSGALVIKNTGEYERT